jgi:integrase
MSGRRGIIEKYILSNPICQIDLSSVKRNDFLEFRERIHSLVLSNNMKNKITGTAKTILREALFRELINRDITTGVGRLRENDKKEKYVPVLDEARSIVSKGDHYESEIAHIAFVILASTGMRRSELIALRWDRIRDKSIMINQAYKVPGRRGIKATYGLPKWSITREIPLPPYHG